MIQQPPADGIYTCQHLAEAAANPNQDPRDVLRHIIENMNLLQQAVMNFQQQPAPASALANLLDSMNAHQTHFSQIMTQLADRLASPLRLTDRPLFHMP